MWAHDCRDTGTEPTPRDRIRRAIAGLDDADLTDVAAALERFAELARARLGVAGGGSLSPSERQRRDIDERGRMCGVARGRLDR